MTILFPTPPAVQPDTMRLYGYLPPFFQQTDGNQGYQFLIWLDGIGQQLQIIDNLVRDTPQGPGWSPVLDITRCPSWALAWFAQFVGVRFTSQQTTVASQELAIMQRLGWERGTLAVLQAAVVPFQVPGSPPITIVERYPDPYSINIIISLASLRGLTYDELAALFPWYEPAGGSPSVAGEFPTYADWTLSTAGITDALFANKPGGLLMTIEFQP